MARLSIQEFAARSAVGGRLSFSSTEASPTTDVTNQATIYYLPFVHPYVGLYDEVEGRWVARKCTTAVSLSLSGGANAKVYDIFLYWTGSAFALERSAAWTNSTTRSAALGTQNGILVKSGTPSKRYIGSYYSMNASGSGEDTLANRKLWNAYNKVENHFGTRFVGAAPTYSSASWGAVRGGFDSVMLNPCWPTGSILLSNLWSIGEHGGMTNATYYAADGLGVDTSSANSAQITNRYGGMTANWRRTGLTACYYVASLGLHTFNNVGFVDGGGSITYWTINALSSYDTRDSCDVRY